MAKKQAAKKKAPPAKPKKRNSQDATRRYDVAPLRARIATLETELESAQSSIAVEVGRIHQRLEGIELAVRILQHLDDAAKVPAKNATPATPPTQAETPDSPEPPAHG